MCMNKIDRKGWVESLTVLQWRFLNNMRSCWGFYKFGCIISVKRSQQLGWMEFWRDGNYK